MMKKNWLRGLILGIALSLILISGIVMAQADIQEEAGGEIDVLAAPPIGGFIEIRANPLENHNPKAAYNSKHDEYLVVWEEVIHGGEVAIYGRRVGINGSPIGAAFPIQHFTNRQLYYPDVAYSAKQDKYLVSFHEKASATNYDIAVVPVSWNGVPGSGYFIDYDADWDWYAAVAYNIQSDEFLVVWEKCISCQGGTQRDIQAQRIQASDGVLLSWRNLASSSNTIRRFPDVAYNSIRNEYLIAYTRHSNISTDGDIIGIKINFNMSGPISEIQITPSGYPPQDGVALTAGPDEYLAVWYEDYGTKNSIWGRRINGDGALQSFFSLANDAGKNRVEPAVAFGDGGKYLVTWRDIAGTWDIYGRNVKAGQNSPEGPEFPIDMTSGAQKVPAAECAPAGPCLVVYEDNFGGATYNIRGRLVGYRRILLPLTLRNR